jgi:hypothetical protein
MPLASDFFELNFYSKNPRDACQLRLTWIFRKVGEGDLTSENTKIINVQCAS